MVPCVLMDGKELSKKIRLEIKNEVEQIKAKTGCVPGLAVIMVGQDPASEIYVKNKGKACDEVGFYSKKIILSEQFPEEGVIEIIKDLNEDTNIHGILVQLPLPAHLNKDNILNAVSSKKDVDAFKAESMGKIMMNTYTTAPCTPAGILALLDEYNIETEGKKCVVVGRSNIVGKPISMMMTHRNATVTLCHSKTQDLLNVCREADILISAVGKRGIIRDAMIKQGAVVIDVGINRDENGKVCGDVELKIPDLPSYITPVPGGVGPMTITMLLKNTLNLMKEDLGIE